MTDSFTSRLEDAIDYAIETDYNCYDRAGLLHKQIRAHKNICIYGMGRFFTEGYPYIKNSVRATYVCDRNIREIIRSGADLYGLRGITPDELHSLPDAVCIIMLGGCYEQAKAQLDAMGIENIYLGDLLLNMYTKKHDRAWFEQERENIKNTLPLLEDDVSRECYVELLCNRIAPPKSQKRFLDLQTDGEYFDTELLRYEASESFADVGAYTGDTIESFLQSMERQKVNVSAIYAFEPDPSSFAQLERCKGRLNCENIELYRLGIAGAEDEKNGLTSLDAKLKDKKITLIKMDIEGYEPEALRGAKQIITEQKPKMAVCLYHRLEDFWQIPQYLKKLNPDYKLYIRHHSPVVWDSVLYVS